MAQHYIVVLTPTRGGGGWRAHFPDFPGCRAEGARVEIAIDAAKRAVQLILEQMTRASLPTPKPSSYEMVRADDTWATERGIEWSTAVTCLAEIE